LTVALILGVIKSVVLHSCDLTRSLIVTSHCASSYSCDVSCVGGVAVLSLYRFSHCAIQVDNEVLVFVNCVLVWRFASLSWSTISSSLSSSLISNSFLLLSGISLNCVIVDRVTTHFSWINISTNKLINYFSSSLKLFRV
jgi:hypothetical protein